jgi:hypothetical protein
VTAARRDRAGGTGQDAGPGAGRSLADYREVKAMKLRYMVIDERGQLRKVSQSAVKGLWEGRRRAETLGCPSCNELRLVSVVCDDDLLPQRIYLLRLPLMQGKFTEESYLTLQLFARPDCVTPNELARHHMAGWPLDFYRQLAVLLDVPISSLNLPLGVGGPLFLAAALRLTPRQALRYLR